jgi:hypothetical protein
LLGAICTWGTLIAITCFGKSKFTSQGSQGTLQWEACVSRAIKSLRTNYRLDRNFCAVKSFRAGIACCLTSWILVLSSRTSVHKCMVRTCCTVVT